MSAAGPSPPYTPDGASLLAEPPSPGHFENPFAHLARNGRLPLITRDRVGREVRIARQDFNECALHKLKDWSETVGKKMDARLFPSFLRHGRQFSILLDGHRLRATDILGHGAYGFVFKAEFEGGAYPVATAAGGGGEGGGVGGDEAKLEVAVKFIFRATARKPAGSDEFARARRLPRAMFASGRIVEYLALCESARFANSEAELVIMELAEMGDLYDSLVQTGKPVLYSADHARRLTAMAIEAMAELRAAGFLHRDLKAENLLFNQHGQMLLGDIGNVKDLNGKKPEQVQTVLGTYATMAPEVYHEISSGHGQAMYDCEKSDVWSLGCIHFQLRTCLSVLNDKLLKASLKDITPAEPAPGGGEGDAGQVAGEGARGQRANHNFWRKLESWQRKIRGPDGVYFRRPDLQWTADYVAEPFSEGERQFLDCLLCDDPAQRPALDELLRAVRGQRGARHGLRWLGGMGNAASGDTTQAFDLAMQQRIAGFGQRKNTYSWTVNGGGGMTPEQFMEVLAAQLRDTIDNVVRGLEYKCDITNPKRTTRTPNCIQLHCVIKGTAPVRRRLLRLHAEIAKPTPQLTGVVTFVRQRGDPALYLQLIKKFEKYCASSSAAAAAAAAANSTTAVAATASGCAGPQATAPAGASTAAPAAAAAATTTTPATAAAAEPAVTPTTQSAVDAGSAASSEADAGAGAGGGRASGGE